MSVDHTCRLCQKNLMFKGVISNTKNLYIVNPREKPLHERFRDVGIFFQRRDGVYSSRICVMCYRKFVRVEEALGILKKWQVYQLTAETEANLSAAIQRRYSTEGNYGRASHLPILRHVASQTDPAKTSVQSTGTQARVPSRDCGMCTLTFPLDSPLLFLQPTIIKRPSKRPRLSLTVKEEVPRECSSSVVIHEPDNLT